MPLHKNLTGADLHEVKGAESASANTVLVATGTGTTTFQKVDVDNIDLTSVKNVNKQFITFTIDDPSTAYDFYLPIEQAKTLDRIDVIISNTVGGANLVVEVLKNSTVIDTETFTVAGTVAGSKFSTTGLNIAFSTSDSMRVRSSATSVSSAGSLTYMFTFNL